MGKQAGEGDAHASGVGNSASDRASSDSETEIKLSVGALGLEAAEAFFRDADSRTLESTYFDTDNLDLRKAGIDLRVRHDGQRLVQTVKLADENGSALTRLEHETELAEPVPDQAHLTNLLPADLRASIADAVLTAQFRTRFDRRSRLVPESHPIAEAVFDRGSIESRAGTMPITEVEFELLENGDIAGLVEICLSFLDTVPAGIAIESKSARGFRLAAGGDPDVVYAKTRGIRSHALLAETIRSLFRQSLRHFLGNIPAVCGTTPPASIHQMRVGLRRLRSTVSAFRPVLDTSAGEAVLKEAKDLFASLGVLRDRDVLVASTLPRIGADIVDRKLLKAIAAEAARERDEAAARLRERLASPEFGRFVVSLVGWIESGLWLRSDRPIDRLLTRRTAGEFAAVRLKELHDRLVKKARKARRRDKKAWHEARIAAKKLRYAAEPLLSALDLPEEASTDYARSLKQLQETLGELNDVETARALLQHFLDGLDGHAKARAAARKNLKRWEEHRSEETLLEAAKVFRAFERTGFPVGSA